LLKRVEEDEVVCQFHCTFIVMPDINE